MQVHFCDVALSGVGHAASRIVISQTDGHGSFRIQRGVVAENAQEYTFEEAYNLHEALTNALDRIWPRMNAARDAVQRLDEPS